MPKYGISRLEMPPSCGSVAAGVKLGEELQQTACEQTAGYEIHPESTDQHQTQIGLKMERDSFALLIRLQEILQKASSLKGFNPSCI